jgi:hypothetical protein
MLRSICRILILTNIFLVCYFVVACAAPFVLHYEIIDKEIQPYYNVYTGLIKKHCTSKQYNDYPQKLVEIVDKLHGNELGVCMPGFNSFKIQILRSWWDNSTDIEKQQMIFHEGAHCLIDQPHINDEANYMNPYFMTLSRQLSYKQAEADIIKVCQPKH